MRGTGSGPTSGPPKTEFIAKRDAMQLRLQNVAIAHYIDTMDATRLPVFVTCADLMMLPATDGSTRILPRATGSATYRCYKRVR